MRIDKYGVARFFEGGDADSAAANDAAAADAGFGDVNSPAEPSTIAGYGGMGDVSVNPNPVADEASNLSQSDLQALSEAGLGALEGINPNNPTQSVEEALAAQNFHEFANLAVPQLMSLAVPGFGALTKGAQVLGAVTSGQTTVGEALSSLGLGVVAQAIGVTPGTLNAALNGNLGQVVANTTMASAPAVIGAITGVPAGMVGLGMNVSGLGQHGNQAIAGTVNEALGVTPSNTALGNIAQSIDAALGTPGGFGGTTGPVGLSPGDFGPGGEFAPPTPTTPTTPANAAQANSNDTAALLALLAASGLEDQNEEAPYKTPFLPQRSASPFGLMYGLENSRMYG